MNKSNEKIRVAARIADVPMWRIANHLGMAPETLSRKLRFEFSPEDQERALKAIAEIAAEQRDGNTNEAITNDGFNNKEQAIKDIAERLENILDDINKVHEIGDKANIAVPWMFILTNTAEQALAKFKEERGL